MLKTGRETAPRAAAKVPTAPATKKRVAPALDSATIEKDDLEEMANALQGSKSREQTSRPW
jgi:hypothetical protein